MGRLFCDCYIARECATPPAKDAINASPGSKTRRHPVTAETYIRAESDRQFVEVVKMAGGVNRLFHFRRPTPLDLQNVVRMNRDTLESMAVVDTSQGATITSYKGLMDPRGRVDEATRHLGACCA